MTTAIKIPPDFAAGVDEMTITNETWDRLLEELVVRDGAVEILHIPGVYELVSEFYNNRVIDLWKSRQPTRYAYGLSEIDDDEWSWVVQRSEEWGAWEVVADDAAESGTEAIAKIEETLAEFDVKRSDAKRLPF